MQVFNGSMRYLFEGAEEPKRQGAGFIMLHPESKKVLLLKRNDATPSWCTVGGGVEAGETPIQAAKREVMEEIGIKPDQYTVINEHKGVPDYTNSTPKIDFHNYIAHAKEQFTPKLNDEHSDWGWFDKDDLPQPLHYGAIRMLDHPEIRKHFT